jgi:hypothetical protein
MHRFQRVLDALVERVETPSPIVLADVTQRNIDRMQATLFLESSESYITGPVFGRDVQHSRALQAEERPHLTEGADFDDQLTGPNGPFETQ